MNSPPSLSWQEALADGFKDPLALCEYLAIPSTALNLPLLHNPVFPLRVPRSYAACMEKGNPDDPLLRQVLPVTEELFDDPLFTLDPVGDLSAHVGSGVIHKYHGRALIITTGSCAINCRYCFRRNFPYQAVQLTKTRLNSTLDYISRHTELTEIILSGGDPLLLDDNRLGDLIMQLNTFSHLRRIRIHSRIPVVLPERVTPGLLGIFAVSTQKLVLVLHANHANELSPSVAAAFKALHEVGVTLLNQAVLLKGVNDHVVALVALSEKLFSLGVLPYYLHLLDKAKGTGHFEVAQADARVLYQSLQTLLPGYLVPKLVREEPGAAFKIPL